MTKIKPSLKTHDTELYLGDCLDVLPTLAAGSVDAVLTDLPYGTTACAWDEIIPLEPMWAAVKHVLKPNGVFVTTSSQPFTSKLIMSNLSWFLYEWIWKKSHATGFLNARRRPLRDHENIIVFCDGQSVYNPQIYKKDRKNIRPHSRTDKRHCEQYGEFSFNADRTIPIEYGYPKTIMNFNSAQHTQHPTQKPVALYNYLVRTYTNPDDVICDMAMGSGTTGVAAIMSGRRFIGIEKEPEYLEMAITRIQQAYHDLEAQQRQPLLLPQTEATYERI